MVFSVVFNQKCKQCGKYVIKKKTKKEKKKKKKRGVQILVSCEQR